MVFHELATNAAKYGSLSVKQGELRIEWTLSSDALHLTWTETAGPACSRPSRRGVGSAVIAGSMAQVGGRVEKEWNPGGLVCRLELPVESVIASEGRQVQTAARPRDQGASSLQGERILIVEDDALLAAELVQTLDAFGCQAVGPAATLEEALRMASGEERLSAAVLDVNLGGRQSELVAKVLKARGVPYVMATGYAEITWTEPGVRLLQKPYPPATLAEALRAAIGSRSELADRADWQ
jgi:CheY-like chemotaxis protein